MRRRFFLLSGLLFLLVGGLLAAAGTYQKALDGKTLVWNSDPKPGDKVEWQGERDADGYATGLGTVTWYTGRSVATLDKAVFFGRYYGNMVRGKLNGPVNVQARGRIAHAYFTDGVRTSPWAGGSAPEWKGGEPQPRTAGQKPTATPSIARAQTPEPMQTEESRPTPKPITNITPKADKTRKLTPSPPPAIEKPAEEISSQSPTAPPEQAAATAAPSTPAPAGTTPTPEQIAATPLETRPMPEQVASTPVETPPAPEQTAPEVASHPEEAKPDLPEEKPALAAATPENPKPKAKRTPPKVTQNQKVKTKFDESLRSLVRPPSTLREGSLPETPAPKEVAPSIGHGGLSEGEAIELANAEATAQGIDLSNYAAPTADYSATKDMWSVLYGAKSAVNEEGVAKPLIVGVEDKTKKAYITSGH